MKERHDPNGMEGPMHEHHGKWRNILCDDEVPWDEGEAWKEVEHGNEDENGFEFEHVIEEASPGQNALVCEL